MKETGKGKGVGANYRDIAVIYAAFTAKIGMRSAGISSTKTASVRSQLDSTAWGRLPRSFQADIFRKKFLTSSTTKYEP